MTTSEILNSGYRKLLKAYPAWFQVLFRCEMENVFAEALQFATMQGWRAVFQLGWREIKDWPVEVCRQYWLGWRKEVTMMEKSNSMINNTQTLAGKDYMEEKTSWLTYLAPLLLLLVWGAAWIYAAAKDIFPGVPGSFSILWVYLAAHTITLVGTGVGWKQNFPRWSYLYVGMALAFSAYWAGIGKIGWNFLDIDFFANGRWGWIAWLPFLVLAGILLLLTRSWQPVKIFVVSMWKDWPKLSLVFYALLVFLFMTIILDGIEQPNEFWSPVWMSAAFLVGAALYMLANTAWKRALGLDLGLFASVGGVILFGRFLNPDTQQFASYSAISPDARLVYILFMSGWVLVWLGLVFLPSVLTIFQRSKRVASTV